MKLRSRKAVSSKDKTVLLGTTERNAETKRVQPGGIAYLVLTRPGHKGLYHIMSLAVKEKGT